jgi:hypothetical protein
VAHGNLGPLRTRKLLFELFVILDYYQTNTKDFWQLTPQKIQKHIKAQLLQNNSLKQEIKDANLRISTSLSKKPSNKHVDLSTQNITRWHKALQSLGMKQKSTSMYAGDVLAKLIEQHHDLRAIP